MLSLTDAIQTALGRKKVPSFEPGNIGDLAKQLNLLSPFSLRELITVLNGLPPASVTFDSGSIISGYVHGSAYLFLQSDGAVA